MEVFTSGDIYWACEQDGGKLADSEFYLREDVDKYVKDLCLQIKELNRNERSDNRRIA